MKIAYIITKRKGFFYTKYYFTFSLILVDETCHRINVPMAHKITSRIKEENKINMTDCTDLN